MHWDWAAIKEHAKVIYGKGSQFLIFLQVVFYLLACVVAGKPIGPKQYVAFSYHVFQWEPGRTLLSKATRPQSRPAPVIGRAVVGSNDPASLRTEPRGRITISGGALEDLEVKPGLVELASIETLGKEETRERQPQEQPARELAALTSITAAKTDDKPLTTSLSHEELARIFARINRPASARNGGAATELR